MEIWKNALRFSVGGGAYVGLELLWRGRSHESMFLAGGTAFLLLGKLNRKRPLPLRAVLGAGIVTAVELAAGLLCNRDYRIWDYRTLPLNYRGQICLPFSLLWIGVSSLAIALYDGLDRLFTGKWPAAAPSQGVQAPRLRP